MDESNPFQAVKLKDKAQGVFIQIRLFQALLSIIINRIFPNVSYNDHDERRKEVLLYDDVDVQNYLKQSNSTANPN